ncbi:sodium/potassium-transporting ATPase subunit alpha-B [Folsomia candida]|uniref:sodium/potassium-transporting ATPase subunit alpha-B n=1 Tax=Folsomia candida TaxID=158441 RepID=UPI000B905B66|nr:sodium/potassium-transporting ATPase subunit alpha-B [Folsomia candida]
MAEGRRYSRKVSIVIEQGQVFSERRASRGGDRRRSSVASVQYRKSDGGIENVAFENDSRRESLRPTYIGHSADVRRKSVHYLKRELEIDYHIADWEVLCSRFNTDLNKGIMTKEVVLNREKFGTNQLTPPKKVPLWLKFLKTLIGGFQLLLWVAAILSFIAYGVQYSETGADTPSDNLYLGITVAAVVILLGMFTFYQEYSSGKVMDSFAKLVPTMATVTRDGKMQHVPANDLVVGDVVDIKFGDSIPADIRIIECQGLKVDNSSLTGESEPQSRSPLCSDDNPMETKNLAFFSTNALEGTGRGLVVAVGDKTCIGRIADLASGMDVIDTPIAREVEYFVKIISIAAGVLGVTFFIVSLCMGYGLLDSGIFLVAIIVANVPEGLLVTFTVILALTAKRMAEKNCVVRQLHAVETLGSCSVICSDKTGTLTQNKMTVSHLWYGDKIVDAGLSDDGLPPDFSSDPGFAELSRVAALCSRAKFLSGQENVPVMKRNVNGDASESAILRFSELTLKNVEAYQRQRQKIFEIPFNSSNKWQVSIHEIEGGKLMVEMKGAPERVLNFCTKIRIGNQIHDLNNNWMHKFNDAYNGLGGLGERVIGFCEAPIDAADYPGGFSENEITSLVEQRGMIFTGLISMIDPPRPGVPNAVENCRMAGIKVVMVTGDHPITATAIARKVGIISAGSMTREEKAASMNVGVESIDAESCKAVVVPGHELLEMSTEELDEVLRMHPEIVFARVSPQQKLIIVEGFQRLGYVVAVTGDGVNDSPALRKADIGVAMGISGSDVSKQAADMILLDDNFSSIVTGCEEGRLIFDNLKKCIAYLLCANISTLSPFLLYIVLQIPDPLGTIQMLAIVLGTDVLPTISLSYEPPEGDIMKRPPRNPKTAKMVTEQLILYTYFVIGMVESVAGMFAYLVVYAHNGFLPDMLMGLSPKWDDDKVTDLRDSYGQEWTFSQRKELEKTGYVAYFCGLLVCQWGNLLVSKCRTSPLYTRLFNNYIVYVAIIGETVVGAFLQYTPGFNYCISFRPLKFAWWLPGLPFTVFIMVFDEFRRFILRRYPQFTWWNKEFLY